MTCNAQISAERTCHFCGLSLPIAVGEPVVANLLDLWREIESAICGQMDSDGWRDGACPECAETYRAVLADRRSADIVIMEVPE